MSISPSTNSPTGQVLPFHVYLSEQQAVEESLDIQSPVYLVVSGLAHRHQLPTIEGGYGLFGGPDRRPISRELSLDRTAYAAGGDLYLAPNRSQWWTSTPPVPAPGMGAARPATRSIPIRAQFSITPKMMALAAMGLVGVALLGFLFWPQGPTTSDKGTPDIAIQAPSPVVAGPTATLLPATPTLEPATQAERNYQDGIKAYQVQDWPHAAGMLQQVYTYDASYHDVRQVLAATLYNWGIADRDGGDVSTAHEHFQAVLGIDPSHPLAPAEQEKATLFLDAGKAASGGDVSGALDKYRTLIKQNGGDYAGATGLLYTLLVARATEVAQAGDANSLRAALNLYREAAGLTVPDRSAAQQGVAEIEPRLPTPIPKPTPKPVNMKLRFRVLNYNDDPSCISVQIAGIVPAGWYFSVDGVRGVTGRFDSGGNARACGVGPGQEVTISVVDGNGTVVAGGAGVPSKGSAIMGATWK
ncbi:MAG: tetratricopeptide repeat protein [Chloroflexales bacterium]